MRQLDFTIVNTDTDSISFCKQDCSVFTKEENSQLLKMLNDMSPEFISWEDDGYYQSFVVLRAKNYILYDGEKIKLKGSGLKSSTLEPALKKMLYDIIECIVFDRVDGPKQLYLDMIRNIRDRNIDIKQWAKKMQLSPTTFNSTRTNETKVIDAIKGTEYKSGDRIYVYAAEGDILKLVEHYNNDYDQEKMYSKVFKATQRFATILPVKELFINYSLKKNKKLLETL